MKNMRNNTLAACCLILALTAYPPIAISSDAEEPPGQERTYSIFYDQGDHLKELVEAQRFEEGLLLYSKYKTEFFDHKVEKFAPLLDQLAIGLNGLYQPRLVAAQAALPRQVNLDPAAWPATREALNAAQRVLDEFAPYEVLMTGSRKSAARDTLAERLNETLAAWRSAAPDAFEKFDLQQDFFATYPVPFDDSASFLDGAFSRVEGRLRAGGQATVLGFSKAYRDVLARSPTLSARLANLYVDLALIGDPGASRLKSALKAVTEATQHGLKPTEVPGLTIAFVEATSQTLLKERQIDFPVAIDVDLPFKTVKSTLDEAFSGKTTFDYVVALEVSMARSLQRAQSRNQVRSQFLSGHKEVPNPEYEPARMAVYQAQNAVSSNNAQYCYGYGCIGKAIAGIALAAKLEEVNTRFSQTPMTQTQPVYQDYQFSASDMNVRKAVTANYYVVDIRNRGYFKSVFDAGEEKNFKLAYDLHDKDKNLDTYLKQYDKEEAVKRFDEAPVTVRLSDVLTQYLEKGGESKPFKSLASLREEMLADKNKALAEYRQRERNQSASTLEDPRFDSVVVVLNPMGSLGTGFYVQPDLVLTNYHVIEGVQFVEMKLRNGLETFGKVVKTDVRLDLALVRVQARGKPVQFHDGPIPLGATVEAIGHPKGLVFSITRGVVSALRKQASPFGIGGKEVLFVQTDTPVNPGNSGGPLFLNNQVVAVNDNKFMAKGIEGIAFSVHYTEVQDFLREGF